MIVNYDGVKEKPDTLRAMTSVNRNEFEALCKVFGQIWDEKTGQLEKDPSKGGRKPILRSAEERLFFILFYLKTYPLQEVLAHLLGMSQGQAHFLIDQLSDILREALKRTGHLPARMPEERIQRLAAEGPQDLGIDGTERRIERPQDPVRQQHFYSGKKAQTVKSVLIGGLEDRPIQYLSDTYEGKRHDKKVCDDEQIVVPAGTHLDQDTGFQGDSIPDVILYQPKKKPRGEELAKAEKVQNRLISGVRVVIEHLISGVKRCRIVKDVFRNTNDEYDDQVMKLACGLHNFGSEHRLVSY